MVQGRAPDWLWPIVPITAALAPASMLAYFIFRVYAAAVAQSTGHYQVCLTFSDPLDCYHQILITSQLGLA